MKKTVIIATAIALVSAFFVSCDNGTTTPLAELEAEKKGTLDLSTAKSGWTFDDKEKTPTADLSYDSRTGFLTIKNKTGCTQVVLAVPKDDDDDDKNKKKTVTVVVSSPVKYRLGLIPKGGVASGDIYTEMDAEEAKKFNDGTPCELQRITLNIDEKKGAAYIAIGSALDGDVSSELMLHAVVVK